MLEVETQMVHWIPKRCREGSLLTKMRISKITIFLSSNINYEPVHFLTEVMYVITSPMMIAKYYNVNLLFEFLTTCKVVFKLMKHSLGSFLFLPYSSQNRKHPLSFLIVDRWVFKYSAYPSSWDSIQIKLFTKTVLVKTFKAILSYSPLGSNEWLLRY